MPEQVEVFSAPPTVTGGVNEQRAADSRDDGLHQMQRDRKPVQRDCPRQLLQSRLALRDALHAADREYGDHHANNDALDHFRSCT
jgi:hypothetical protein